jgi:hypothetical protein
MRNVGVAGLVLAAAVVGAGQVPASASTAPAITIRPVASVTTASKLPPFVIYRSAKYSAVRYTGHVTNVTAGMVLRFYAKRFPYSGPWHKIGRKKFRHAGTGHFRFRAAPVLATRYRVELFLNASSRFALAESRVSTVYVLAGYRFSYHKTCGHPVCRLVIHVHVLLPPVTLAAEISKQIVTYFGRTLARHGRRPQPVKWLYRNGGHSQVIGPRQAAAGQIDLTLDFSFRIGRDSSAWSADFCTRNTESRDGLNLPGHHGCGSHRIKNPVRYLG